MAATQRVTSKCISSLPGGPSLKRAFVSATNPSLNKKIDKEEGDKIVEAAETVKHGTQDVVEEVKHVGHAVTQKIDTTGDAVAEVAEKSAENSGKGKGIIGSIKEKILNK